MNITVEILEEYNEDVAMGLIFAQYPTYGSILLPGEQITVTVSEGSGLIRVPDLIGQLLADAHIIMGELPLHLNIERNPDSNAPVNTIYNMNPAPYALVESDTIITIFVSSPQTVPLVTVPNFVGMPDTEWVRVLIGSGLVQGNISLVSSDTVEEGTITIQTIDPGREVEEGTVINFVVSSGPADASQPEENGYEDMDELPIDQGTGLNIPVQGEYQTRTAVFPMPGNLPDGTEVVHAAAIMITGNTPPQRVLYEPTMHINSFPYVFPVHGTGQARIEFMINGILVHEDVIDFS